MSKKSGWLHGEVDAFDSHEQGWHPSMNLLEKTCRATRCAHTQNTVTVESKLPWCETVEQGLLLFYVSFNMVQCTTDHTGHVLHARTDSVPLCLSRLQQSAHRVDALALAQTSRLFSICRHENCMVIILHVRADIA